jgi:hypothetical protein
MVQPNSSGFHRKPPIAGDASPISQGIGTTLCVVGICIASVLACFLPGIVADGYADPASGDPRASLLLLQPGEVTANNGGGDVVINNHRYMALPSVTVTDDEGRPRELKEVVPGTQVRFHLRGEKIDQLVILLPR